MGEKNDKEYIEFYKTKFKNIIIEFDVLFKNPEYAKYNNFIVSLASKKAYLKMSSTFCDENNKILNRNLDLSYKFIYNLFSIKKAVDTGFYKNKSYKNFITDLVTLLFDQEMINEIKKYIDENYVMNIGDEIDSTKNYQESITFLDRHCKILYLVSCMSRFVLSFATHYVYVYPSVDANKLIHDLIMMLLEVAQGDSGINIYNKLEEFIKRDINKTLHSDKQMWSRKSIMGTTPETTLDDILTKIIINTIPKFSFDKNIMNFLKTVVKINLISYTFRKKDYFNLHCISDLDTGSSGDDNNILSETEVFESYNEKHDELVLLLRENFVYDTIEKICVRNNIYFTNEEFLFYHNSIKFQEFQRFCVTQIFASYFGGAENVYSCNKAAYIQLIILLTKLFDKLDIGYMSKYVTGIRFNYRYKRLSKMFESEIMEDPRYELILKNKYKFVEGLFSQKNIVRDKILYLYNNQFKYNMLGCKKNGELIEKDEKEIMNGVLEIYLKLIK